MTRKNKQPGFTIVELLIVIVVIGILAAIALNAYAGVQDRARQAKIDTDLAALEKAVHAARIAEGGTALRYITNSTHTGEPCWSKPAGTDLSTLPKLDNCWTSYEAALSAISDKSGTNVKGLIDPWGYPYFIDENEQEVISTYCVPDQIGIYNRPAGGGFDSSRSQHRDVSTASSVC